MKKMWGSLFCANFLIILTSPHKASTKHNKKKVQQVRQGNVNFSYKKTLIDFPCFYVSILSEMCVDVNKK